MKRSVLFLAIVVALSLGLVSCMDQQNQYKPYVVSSIFLLNNKDTISLKLDTISGFYVLDTIHVNDTVNHAFACATYANTLLSVVLSQDGESVKTEVLYNSTILAAVSSTEEEVAKGNLVFYPNYNGVSFPVRMVGLEKGRTDICWTVSSDSKLSPSQLKFRVVVAE